MSSTPTLESMLQIEKEKNMILSFLDPEHKIDLGFGTAIFRPSEITINGNQKERLFFTVPMHVVTKEKEYNFMAALPKIMVSKKTTQQDVQIHLETWILNPFKYHKSSSSKAYYHCLLSDGRQSKPSSTSDFVALEDLKHSIKHKKLLLHNLEQFADQDLIVRYIMGHLCTVLSKFFIIAAEIPGYVVSMIKEIIALLPPRYNDVHYLEGDKELAMWVRHVHWVDRHGNEEFGVTSFFLKERSGIVKRVNTANSKLVPSTSIAMS